MLDTPAPWTQDILVGYGDLKPLGPDTGMLGRWPHGLVAKVCILMRTHGNITHTHT